MIQFDGYAKEVINSRGIIWLYLISFFLLFVCILTVALNRIVGTPEVSSVSITLLVLMIIFQFVLIYFSLYDRVFVSPGGFYILSVLVFIMSRPIVNLLSGMEIVQVGSMISDSNILDTIVVICVGLFIFHVSFLFPLQKFGVYRSLDSVLFSPSAKLNNKLMMILFCIAILCILYFLFLSYQTARVVGTTDYLDVVSNPDFYTHLRWFFLAKSILLICLIGSGSTDRTFITSLILFLGSIGFIIIGLRGYTISYFFLFLYFLSSKKSINFGYLVIIGVMILYISALALEYRLGFSVFESPLEMIYMPFYQQGATFEVVFGAVHFTDLIKKCIPYDEFFSGNNFGDCVDWARGVPFVNGGFASSYFAEAFYFGYFFYAFFFIVIGVIVRYMDYLSFVRKLPCYISENKFAKSKINVFLFFLIPNLVYFSRSSVMDFPVKFVSTIVVLFVFLGFSNVFKGHRV